MGNSCACFGGGSDYAFAGRKKVPREPEITNLDGRPRSASDNVVPPAGRRGSYKMTTTSAKYAAPQDVNRNISKRDSDDLELNFQLQTPVLDNSDVRTFFDETQSDKTPGNVFATSGNVPNVNNSGSANTHVQVFSLAKSPATSTQDANSQNATLAPTTRGTTHVEVFSLKVADDQHAKVQTEHEQTQSVETVHINMTAFLGHESPKRSDVGLGTDNPAFVSKETSSSTVHMPGADVPARDASTVMDNTTGHNTQTTAPNIGVVNTSFIADDIEVNHGVASGCSDLGRVSDLSRDSACEEPDENCFFFGMESLKFCSQVSPGSKGYGGEEANREIADIMADIDSIEDGVWLTLRPPTDGAEHVVDPEVVGDVPGDAGTSSNLYEDVLDQLRGVCEKVENLLRRKGVDNKDEVDAEWLKLPDLTTIDQKYQKKTSEAQTNTVARLLKASKHNDEQKVKDILSSYKRQQERLLRMRDIERRKLMERLKLKMKSKNISLTNDDQDEEQTLRSHYGRLVASDDESEEEILVGDDFSSDYDYTDSSEQSALSYTDDGESSTESDPDAKKLLKATLTHDIQSRMKEMTSDDFRSIMGLYRKERSNIRSLRESERNRLNQSLWEKMAERRRHVDKSIYEGEEDSVSQTSNDNHAKPTGVDATCNTTTSGGAVAHRTVASGQVIDMTDAATDADTDLELLICINKSTGITDQELSTLNEELLSKTTQSGRIDQSDVDELMKNHFNNVKKMREAREQAALAQRQTLMEKLRNHKGKVAVDVDSLEKDLKQEDNELAKEEELLEKTCVKTLHDRQSVTREDLADVLNRYKLSQDALNKQRTRQRGLLNERLREKLSGRTRVGTLDDVDENSESSGTPVEKQRTQAEHRIADMDEAFYKSLLDRKAAGEISEDDLAMLIDKHLNKVDEFRKAVRKQMNQRRRERQQHNAAEQVSALVEEDRQNREQVRRLRKDERDKMDDKMKEKLKKRRQKRQQDGKDQTGSGRHHRRTERHNSRPES